MNDNVARMSAGRFAYYVTHTMEVSGGGIAARDAYLKAEALKEAVERAAPDRCGKEGWEQLRNVILGRSPFVKGQLVRCLKGGAMIPYDPQLHATWELEAMLNRDGEPICLAVEEDPMSDLADRLEMRLEARKQVVLNVPVVPWEFIPEIIRAECPAITDKERERARHDAEKEDT